MRYEEDGSLASYSDRQVVRAIRNWVIVAVLVISAVSLIGWQVGWWFNAENVDRQVRVDNTNTGTQTAWHDEVLSSISDYELLDPADTARRGAVRRQACELIPRLTDEYYTPEIQAFDERECQ